jgi:RimJ/RimL family protein N-acetyltransferase
MGEDSHRSLFVVKISIEPLNFASKKFHMKKGFRKVGRLKDEKSCNMYIVNYPEYLKWKDLK